MKRNGFGEPICEPGDDPAVIFADCFGIDMSDNLIGYRFVEEDPNFGWCCELETECGARMQAQGFESEQAIRDWLECNFLEGI